MRKINILTHNNKIQTISFNIKKDLLNFICFNTTISKEHSTDKVANIIWNLNVGSMYFCCGYRFSIVSKREVA